LFVHGEILILKIIFNTPNTIIIKSRVTSSVDFKRMFPEI